MCSKAAPSRIYPWTTNVRKWEWKRTQPQVTGGVCGGGSVVFCLFLIASLGLPNLDVIVCVTGAQCGFLRVCAGCYFLRCWLAIFGTCRPPSNSRKNDSAKKCFADDKKMRGMMKEAAEQGAEEVVNRCNRGSRQWKYCVQR